MFWDDELSRGRFLKLAIASGLAGLGLGAHLEGKTYRIQKGDTLSSIAKRNGVSVGDLKRANGLRSDTIIAGQSLEIPEASDRDSLQRLKGMTRGLGISKNRWKFVVIHHSATKHGNAEIFDSNHRRRWRDGLAYHFVIGNGVDSGDGEIEMGRRWEKQIRGAHCKASIYNEFGIGVCLVGNFMETKPSSKQLVSLHNLIGFL
ncbi:MAG: LysM peptidoglycan-binding domain-containing protein, partial [Verrucomicrobiota bacterium]